MADGYPLKRPQGAYGREKYLTKLHQQCDVCGKRRDVIATDSSEGEYSLVRVCRKCAIKIFNTPKNSIMFQ